MKAKIRELRREKLDMQLKAKYSDGPESQDWKDAEARNQKINEEIEQLRRTRRREAASS